jgi:hypothetical protein
LLIRTATTILPFEQQWGANSSLPSQLKME